MEFRFFAPAFFCAHDPGTRRNSLSGRVVMTSPAAIQPWCAVANPGLIALRETNEHDLSFHGRLRDHDNHKDTDDAGQGDRSLCRQRQNLSGVCISEKDFLQNDERQEHQPASIPEPPLVFLMWQPLNNQGNQLIPVTGN